MKKIRNVLKGSIPGHMLRLAIPSIGGMFAITVFNLTDTFFVSKLGTNALAAMGFTFPIVMIVGSFSAGISMGAGSILARAMGAGDHHKMKRIGTDGILLSALAVGFIALLGLMTMDPLFIALGATPEVLPLVKDYMFVWYAGVVVVVLPPVSDACMRAMGDMVRPLMVMLVCAVFNVILDPILIFGYFGLPAMGIQGAALATVIARFLGMILTLSFNHFHYHLLDFKYESIKEMLSSWNEILTIGLPGALVRLLPQIIRTATTKLAAIFAGSAGVAALAAGTRIESFQFIISMAIGTAIVPIVGQNYGAKQYERVAHTKTLITSISLVYGLALTATAFFAAEPVVKIFTTDEAVVPLAVNYLIIMFAGGIGLNLYNWLSEALNSVGKPRLSLAINLGGTLLVILPAVALGAWLGGFNGMIIGLAIAQIIIAFISHRITADALLH